MDHRDIHLLYEYDRWANARVLTAAVSLTPEQFTRDLGGSFRSVRDTLVHIIGGEWIWLAYWKAESQTPESLAELRAQQAALFNPQQYPNIDSVQAKWAELEKEQTEFVARLTDEALKESIAIRGVTLTLVETMQHLANHSTYHRGQVSLMMRQLKAEPAATDFSTFVIERAKSAASA